MAEISREDALLSARTYLESTMASFMKWFKPNYEETTKALAGLLREAKFEPSPDHPDHDGDFDRMRDERDKWLLTCQCHCIVLEDQANEIASLKAQLAGRLPGPATPQP